MPWQTKKPDLKNDPTYLEPRITANESQLAQLATDPNTFGAIGDGITDSTTAISNALDSSKNTGRLVFKPGVYIVSSIFKTNINNLSIEALIPGTVTIKRKSGTYGNNPDGSTSGIFTFAQSDNIRVKGITFDGNKVNATPINGVAATNVLNFCDCDNVTVDNIKVINGHFIGCALQVCNNQKIVNSTFESCGWGGLNIGGGYFEQVGATDVWIENNRFLDTWSGLVVSVYVDRVDVINNVFLRATCNFSQTVSQAKISSNKFFGQAPASDFGEQAFSAITLECDYDIIIDGNDIIDSAWCGIYVYGSFIESGPKEGVITSDNIQITNNKIRKCNGAGILYSGGSPYTYDYANHTGTPTDEANSTKSENCIIHGNIVSECEGSGINVGLSNNVIVSNNQTFLNKLHGVVLGACDKVDIKNNFVYNNSKAGTDAYNGIDLGSNTNVENVMICDNKIYDNQATRTQRFGIMVNNSLASDIRVRNNVIYGNGGEIYSVVSLDPYPITTATLEAGATIVTGYEPPKFYRDGDNIVHFLGSIYPGTDLLQRMFTLPIGYRPDVKQRISKMIIVDTNGYVMPANTTTREEIDLTGLSFKAKPYLT
jgi:parallel beta-helix repeat protein